MTLSALLKDKLPHLLGLAFALLFTAALLSLLRVPPSAAVFLCLVLSLCVLLPLGGEIARKLRFYRDMAGRLDALEEKYLFSEVMAEPGFPEGEFLFSTAQAMGASMAEAVGDARPLIEAGFRVELEALDAVVCSDGKWVEFILGQLISNSLKYRSAAPRLTFSQAVKRDGVVLSLRDNGPGIPPEDLPRVFDKGFTGANGRHLSTRSTGLGLYLCRKLCARLGLGLSLSCPPGGGTLASLTFPLGRFHLAEGQPYKTVTSP